MADEVIEIEDIVDGDSLKEWLTDWPASQGLDEEAARQIAVTIAHRAAMRVMPLWWEWSLKRYAREHDLTALAIFRSLLVSGVSAKSPTPETRRAANAAVNAVNATNTAVNAVNAVNTAAFSAIAAANTAAAATTANATEYVAYAAFAASTADSAPEWASIRADCTAITTGVNVFATWLWYDPGNPLEDLWSLIKTKVSEPEWAFWIKLYDDALVGRAPNWDMLEQIALIDSEVWDAGPVAVAAEIENIKKKFEPHQPTKLDAITIQHAVAQNLPSIPPQIEALVSTIDAEIEWLRGKNPEDDMEKQEIDQLTDTFKAMRGAVVGLSELLPSKGVPTTESAEEMGDLLQVFGNEFRKWPRENAADLVDSSCRVVLIGLTAGLFTTFGLPALAGTAIGGLAFGGKKLVGTGKAVKDVTPTGT